VLAVGEIGLDYHYNLSPPEVQRAAFAEQLRIAVEGGKPAIIHTREAWDDTMRLIRESGVREGVMHCFTGGPAEVTQVLDAGFHVSFAGMITFLKAQAIRDAAALVPTDRLLVETDAPYLAPVPHRGKRNEPAFMVETVRQLAAIRGVEPERVADETSRNFERLCLRGAPASGYTG
jgi:TatD DNase family protein